MHRSPFIYIGAYNVLLEWGHMATCNAIIIINLANYYLHSNEKHISAGISCEKARIPSFGRFCVKLQRRKSVCSVIKVGLQTPGLNVFLFKFVKLKINRL